MFYRIANSRVLALVETARDVVADRATAAVPDAARGDAATNDTPDTASNPAVAPGLHVVFDLGGEECAIPVAQVLEVLAYEPPRRVPSTLPGLIGVRSVRREVIGVHDLAVVLGHRGGAPESLLVAVDSDGRKCGLAVGGIRGVERLEVRGAGRPDVPAPGTSGIALGARGLVLVLDADALLAVLFGSVAS